MSMEPGKIAERALEAMQKTGFNAAQVSVSISEKDEFNVNHNNPSLLRSTEDHGINLVGILDHRKASMTLTDLGKGAIDAGIQELFERTRFAPRDEANAVAEDQTAVFEQGPVEGDMDLLTRKVRELLAFRADKTPKVQIEEASAVHKFARETLLTTAGTRLSCKVGSYSLSVMATASENGKASSFNYTGGVANDVSEAHASKLFGIGDMLMETEQQIDAGPIGGNFVGDIILAPTAVSDLLGWLLSQLRDHALIAGTSLFKDRVGQQIANEMLTVRSRFDAPGHATYTTDGFLTPPLTLVEKGRLNHLLPSLYGSLKTGITHTPASSGWSIDKGGISRDDLVACIAKGAMVNRLSMGSPGPNGDFSGVIKNSFMIEGGGIGRALSETMIAGNMAKMLNNIAGISSEHLDLGTEDFPWIRINNLNFS